MDDCQKAFEKWFVESKEFEPALDKYENGIYKYHIAQICWIAFRAAWEARGNQ